MSFRAGSVIPILRIFSVEKAREFYVDYMGCKVDWEHRFDERAPLYMQVSRDGLVLHLSEHHGDGSPGVSFKVNAEGVRELHAELSAKKYGYWRPGLNETFYGALQLKMLDPFGNQIFLEEPLDRAAAKGPQSQADGAA
jgi:catechol 2,3-dioxygenase-like lactoylglutathione lyase family enzyme